MTVTPSLTLDVVICWQCVCISIGKIQEEINVQGIAPFLFFTVPVTVPFPIHLPG